MRANHGRKGKPIANGSTPNYGFILPEVGADNGAWGTHNSANWSDIDTDLKAVSDAVDATVIVANAAMPKAGGTFTGLIRKVRETYVRGAGSGTSGSITFNCSTAHAFALALSNNGSFTLSNTPVDAAQVEIWISNPSGYTMTWTTTVNWESSIAHELGGVTTYGGAPGASSTGGPGFLYIVTLHTDGSDWFGSWRRF